MGGHQDYKVTPLIAWENTCTPRKYGGLGLKNFIAWNKARIAKLIWSIAQKKDILWVKWVHERYLKQQDWSYQQPSECSWYWRKLTRIKELFKQAIQPHPVDDR